MRVLVTGASGHLGRVLVPALLSTPGITAVTGIDGVPAPFAHARYVHVRMTLPDPAFGALARSHDALIHLAFRVFPRGIRDARANLLGTRQVFDATRGLRRRLFLSSASVYGWGSDLDETAPLMPSRGFAYARQKAALERWIQQYQADVVGVRCQAILGAHAQPMLRALARLPCYPAGSRARFQAIHESDATQAVLRLLSWPGCGALNLAGQGDFTLRDLACARGPALPLPGVIYEGVAALCGLSIHGRSGAAWTGALRHGLTLDTSKLARALDWEPGPCPRVRIVGKLL